MNAADSGSADLTHKHIWEVQTEPIREDEPTIDLSEFPLRTGPVECPCGMSKWYINGWPKQGPLPRDTDGFDSRNKDSFAPILRLQTYKEKLDRGEELTPAEQADIQAIGEDLMETMQPILDAIARLADDFVRALQPIIASLRESLPEGWLEKFDAMADRVPEAQVVMPKVELSGLRTGVALGEIDLNPVVEPKSALDAAHIIPTLTTEAMRRSAEQMRRDGW